MKSELIHVVCLISLFDKNSMIVREANDSDVPAITRVHIDTWRTTYSGIMPEDYLAKLSYEKREQGWTKILNSAANSGQFVYVAEDESGQIVGFANGSPERTGNPCHLYPEELPAARYRTLPY
jgi:hypothetical protein